MATSFSKHMMVDRVERYLLIATKVGFGEVLYTTQTTNRYGEVMLQLTTTGVLIVRAVDDTIITMYCASLAVVKSCFKMERLPKELYFTIRENEKKGYCNR